MKLRSSCSSLSLAVACAVLLSLGAAAHEEQREDSGDGEDGESCMVDAVGAAELSVLSRQNSSGHWLAKVRLLHAAGPAGEGASLPPVQLQMQRSTQIRRGGARAVAIEATLAGSPAASHDAAATNDVLDSAFTPFLEPKTSCTPPQPCPLCPTPQPCPTSQPCPSPCPSPCPPFPSFPACPEPPTCPSPCPACPACPLPPACPEQPKCPSPCPTTISAAKRIPPGYVLKEGLGYYKYHTVPVNWFEAKATCEREGAHLVILNSQDEAKMVVNFFKELKFPNYGDGIRVGLHDLLHEGSFLTVLGQPIATTGFANWIPGEPNNGGKPAAFGGEHCVTLHCVTLQIYDISCDWNGTFVCEFPH